MKKAYFSFSEWLTSRFHSRVQKIPLDLSHLGLSCPNRDGYLSTKGCTFCNAQGSGSGLGQSGHSVAEQWAFWQAHYALSPRNRNTKLFMAYLQSFTNTYGSLAQLRIILAQLQPLPQLVGLAVGTRPDCLDEEKMALLASQNWPELWLELGVQSSHNATLARIRRGHSVECSEQAIHLAARHGVKVCAHLMVDLPGESPEDFFDTVRWLAALPVAGVKMHGLYICHNTDLALDYQQGLHQPQSMEEYCQTIAHALPLLPAGMVIHRLTADPGQEELVAPTWVRQKGDIIRRIEQILAAENLWQGKWNDAPTNPFL